MRPFLIICLATISFGLQAQNKKMTPLVYDEWNQIESVIISDDGQWVSYVQKPEKGDGKLILYNTTSKKEIQFPRGSRPGFDKHASMLCFIIKPHADSLLALERRNVEKEDWPSDTLAVFHLKQSIFDKFPDIKSYKIAGDMPGILAFHKKSVGSDTTLVKSADKDNGTPLFVMDILKNKIQNFEYVKDYQWSEKNGRLLILHTGKDSANTAVLELFTAGLWQSRELFNDTVEIFNPALNKQGDLLAFAYAKNPENTDSSSLLFIDINAGKNVHLDASMIGDRFQDWSISQHFTPRYISAGRQLLFGIAAVQPLPDTSLADSEKAELEIWNYRDGLLYTHQNARLDSEKKRAFEVLFDPQSGRTQVLCTPDVPELYYNEDLKGNCFLSYSELPYQQFITSLGYAFKDVYITNIPQGETRLIADSIQGRPRLSPHEQYAYWYNRHDSAWHIHHIESGRSLQTGKGRFFDELNDRPMHPRSYGFLGWMNSDEAFLVYDRYDIWRIDPMNGSMKRMTKGRENKLRFRHISLDEDINSYPSDTTLLLHVFDENDKSSGYAQLDLKTLKVNLLVKGPYAYTDNIIKARDTNSLIFTRSSFRVFPDLVLSDLNFEITTRISQVNPQQADYAWGDIRLFKWKYYNGEDAEGLLVTPPDFDPSKKYPLIVNFYERSSDRLHRHRAPYPHRSTINYSYWANKGYVIFNPDISYEVGYPGKSCLDAVMSGVDALLEEGFVDASRMGLQGHSWGGYQIAYILTQTNRFACAEAGAPVVNMTSAYGGIRWGSGLSRMFQYEQTQSRLGATLWEEPELYLENSPLFMLDKVETPVLILHNDKDGAVPWYQGIEYFVGLRRLGKPAWMLNYNNEPHWPVKRPNRLDFNRRLEQFFDHYLMSAPMPEWMSRGIPATHKGINDGFGLEPDNR